MNDEFNERRAMVEAEYQRVAAELPKLAETIEGLRDRIIGLASQADDLGERRLSERVNLLAQTLNDVLHEGQ